MAGGALKRTAAAFTGWVKRGGEFPPETGRYHLYVSYACPWASRCLAVRSLLGLEDTISVSVVHPTWQKTRPEDPSETHCGWVFRDPSEGPLTNTVGFGTVSSEGATPDHVLGKRTIRQIYEASNDTHGKYSVPILFDKKTQVIVNNESSDIIQMFASEFAEFQKTPTDVDLFPAGKEAEMKEVDDILYPGLNNGVYRAGFAQAQEPFDKAVKDIFETLDWLEERLGKSRYLLGDKITASDIRAYVTLVRFDHVYVVHFKCSTKMIREYPNVFAYTRDLYQNPKIRETTNLDHIVRHYYTSHTTLNRFAIIPPCGTDFDLPHDRATRKY
eukprot:TRINITY_DN239_c0_g1_i1.p1 TRINITY_DN239_c0_g1~~TRINITY_DN239_c0_g1_i1.p1  ORF type:complete len:359 (+),score=136.42 TRINITY_DN239_c0_g1_i1:93-1079(+)